MSETALQCEDLAKTFNDGNLSVEVLKGINLSVETGECIAIVGSSGSGKSTLLHLLGGLDKSTSGSVSIRDKNIESLGTDEVGVLRNEQLGFIYQFHHLLPEFTAVENVAMPLLIRGEDPAEAKAKSEEILTDVGLGERLEHKPGELSGGERQRAAIARALVTRPGCILADEPTGNLDEHTATAVFDVMMELNKKFGISMVMVTHNRSILDRFDRVYVLQDGQLHQRAG